MIVNVSGLHLGSPAFLSWEDGHVDGDPLLLELAKARVAESTWVRVDPGWPTVEASLVDPMDFVVTVGSLLDPGTLDVIGLTAPALAEGEVA